MSDDELYAVLCLVHRMRESQRAYFRFRSQACLVEAKQLERQVDDRLRPLLMALEDTITRTPGDVDDAY